jgi:PAS domain S-box-containing protein
LQECTTIKTKNFNPKEFNILIVEDSKSFNKILMDAFTKEGFVCYSATTLKEAYEQIETNTIHYILLDINLPDGNGYELIKKLENTPEKIFVLTNEEDRQFREVSYQRGVIDYIVKDKRFFYKIHQVAKTIEQLEKNKQKTILVIDDSYVIQEQLKEILQNRYYYVEVASTTEEALRVLSSRVIDLIFLDIQIGKSNGIEFLEKNHQLIIDIKKIPVLIISGSVTSTTIRDGLKAGAMDILQKPYVIEELVLKADMWIDYKRKEDEITSSSKILEEYKDTVDESSIVSKADIKGIITFVNQKFCEISGYTEEELLGKPHSILRHPDMPKEAFADLWHTIKELKQTWRGKVKNKKKDGGYYWVEATIKPILDIDGNIAEFIGLRNDITELEELRVALENELEDTHHSLEEYKDAIINNSAITKLGIDLNIKFVNDEYLLLSKYSRQEMIGKPIIDFVDEESLSDIDEVLQVIQSGEVYRGVFKGKPKYGEPYYTKTTIKPIKNTQGEIIEYLLIKDEITELINSHQEIEATQKEIVYKMGEIGESRSKETGNHVKRVAEYSKLLATLYGLDEKEAEILFTASPMHDIGKVAIPDSVLNKPGKLTIDEFEVMKSHAEIGYEVLKGSNREVLKAAATVAYEHHEKWDGSGYPRGLKGEDIHIYGRITSVADVFDALGHERCYKPAWELERILALFEEEKGKMFDPRLIELFLENLGKFLEIRDNFKD